MSSPPLPHSESSCLELLTYLFKDHDELCKLAATYLEKTSDLEETTGQGTQDRKDVFRVLGLVTWEIFSDNNEVVDTEGRLFDLGTQRASGTFIADFLNTRYAPEKVRWFDNMDFYFGFEGDRDPALSKLFAYFFQKLKERHCIWRNGPSSRMARDTYEQVYGVRPIHVD